MKLYTEEQVNELMVLLQQSFLPENIECDGAYCMGCWKDVVRETLKKMANLSPIELPSEEEIEKFIEKGEIGYHDPEWDYPYGVGVTQAIEWVINRIKQQDK